MDVRRQNKHDAVNRMLHEAASQAQSAITHARLSPRNLHLKQIIRTQTQAKNGSDCSKEFVQNEAAVSGLV